MAYGYTPQRMMELADQFDREHPFMPSSVNPMRSAPTGAPDAPPAIMEQAPSQYGTTGGLITPGYGTPALIQPPTSSDQINAIARGDFSAFEGSGAPGSNHLPSLMQGPAQIAGPSAAPSLMAQPSVAQSGEALMLSSILPSSSAAPMGKGIPSLMTGGYPGQVLSAAAGLEDLRTQTEADRNLKLMEQAHALPSQNDTPEVRQRKINYLDYRTRMAAAGRSVNAPNSNMMWSPEMKNFPAIRIPAPSTADLAASAHQIMAQAGQPRLVTLGKDAEGKPIQGVSDRAGNFHPLRDGKESGVQQVKIGPKNYLYHADSKRYFDEQGNPVVFPSGSDAATAEAISRFAGGEGASQGPVTPTAGGQPPAQYPTLTPDQARTAKPGTLYLGTDGKLRKR